jgi:hypothetical protein
VSHTVRGKVNEDKERRALYKSLVDSKQPLNIFKANVVQVDADTSLYKILAPLLRDGTVTETTDKDAANELVMALNLCVHDWKQRHVK